MSADTNREQPIAILMADLSGYTAMTEMHGAQAAAQLIGKYERLVRQSLHGASFLHERAGDQVVVLSPRADDLAHTALDILQRSAAEHHFLPVHAGLHFGDALGLNGHYYGSAMNLAARIAAQAKKGQLLCSMDFIGALSAPDRYRYSYHGQFRFKNVRATREVVELRPFPSGHLRQKATDPVCRMQVDKATAGIVCRANDRLYHFCSETCRAAFLRDRSPHPALPVLPELYTSAPI